MRKRIQIAFLVFVMAGCAPWATVGGKYRMQSLNCEAELPAGWHRATSSNPLSSKDSLLITRDGVFLQYIELERVNIDRDLEYTKKKFRKTMFPQEVAEVEVDNVRFDPTIMNFEIVENIPCEVAGFPGFKLVYAFRNREGLRIKRIHYGFMLDDWVYRLVYQAPARHYYEKDIETFEKIRETLIVTLEGKINPASQ